MADIRVVIADDSVVMRRWLAKIIDTQPRLQVVAAARNGLVALDKIEQLSPDVVVLDVEMPELDGLGALKEIRARWPRLPVIMFSAHTQRGAESTLDALGLGANSYVTKPSGIADLNEAERYVRTELCAKIAALSERSAAPASGATASARITRRQRIDAVVIAVSTGGPQALAELLPTLPGSLPVPVFIVQHMPKMFTRLLAERIDKNAPLPVREIEPGPIDACGIWIAQGERHMVVRRRANQLSLAFDDGPPENSCRPAADVLFRSAAAVFGGNTLAVVLTGMGKDGLAGCKVIADAGGQVITQDKQTSVVYSMPAVVAEAGLSEKILPLPEIAPEIVRRVLAYRETAQSAGAPPCP